MRCETVIENIFELGDLPAKEQREFLNHLKECEDCRRYFQRVRGLFKQLQKSMGDHIEPEVLVRYTGFLINPKEPDFDGTRLSEPQISAIQAHLEKCPACAHEVEKIRSEFIEMDAFLTEQNFPELVIGKIPFHSRLAQRISLAKDNLYDFFRSIFPENQSVLKPIFITAIAVALILLVFIPFLQKDELSYSQLAQLEPLQISYLTRSGEVNELNEGIRLFNEGDFSPAVSRLESFIENHPLHPNRSYAHFIAGAAHLMQVKDEQISGEDKRLNQGIIHLEKALAQAQTIRMQEDALWYLGKASLIKQNGREALNYFSRIPPLNGRRASEAREMISGIEKILISEK